MLLIPNPSAEYLAKAERKAIKKRREAMKAGVYANGLQCRMRKRYSERHFDYND